MAEPGSIVGECGAFAVLAKACVERSDQHRLAIEIDVDRSGTIAHGCVSR